MDYIAPSTDGWRCSRCGATPEVASGDWRWAGHRWEHACPDRPHPQCGHFAAVRIEREREIEGTTKEAALYDLFIGEDTGAIYADAIEESCELCEQEIVDSHNWLRAERAKLVALAEAVRIYMDSRLDAKPVEDRATKLEEMYNALAAVEED